MPTHALHKLQAAVREYAAHVAPGIAPRRVVILDASREAIADLLMNPCVVQVAPVEVEEDKPGWDFSRKVARFDGTECAGILGKPLAVLKLLAAANGPLSVEELRAAWDGYPATDSTVRGTVAELRKKLQTLWPRWEGDPVPSTGAGYALEIR